MDIERELAGLLVESADRVCVPVHTMVAEASRRGRRLRLLRRLRIAGATLAVTGLLATGAVLNLDHGGPVHPAASTPAGRPNAPGPDGPDAALTTELTATLRDMLPAGGSLRVRRDPVVTDHLIQLELRYDDGLSPVTLLLELTARPAGDRPDCDPEIDPDATASGVLSCTGATTTDGVVSTTKSYQGGPGMYSLVYTFRPARGVQVGITVGNSDGSASDDPVRSRREPPLPAWVWQNAVENRAWQAIAVRAALRP